LTCVIINFKAFKLAMDFKKYEIHFTKSFFLLLSSQKKQKFNKNKLFVSLWHQFKYIYQNFFIDVFI
jgi:hypothetical protein